MFGSSFGSNTLIRYLIIAGTSPENVGRIALCEISIVPSPERGQRFALRRKRNLYSVTALQVQCCQVSCSPQFIERRGYLRQRIGVGFGYFVYDSITPSSCMEYIPFYLLMIAWSISLFKRMFDFKRI